jgi:hypothetical protein
MLLSSSEIRQKITTTGHDGQHHRGSKKTKSLLISAFGEEKSFQAFLIPSSPAMGEGSEREKWMTEAAAEI